MLRLGLIIIILSPLLLSYAASSVAATQSIQSHIAFDELLSITKTSDIDFGHVKANQSGTYTVSPQGVISASNSGVALGGSVSAAKLTIAGSSSQTINISAGNYVASNGVTPSMATCSYNDGATAPCSLSSQTPPGNGKPLLVGITVDVDGNQAVSSTAAPSFDIIVNYQ